MKTFLITISLFLCSWAFAQEEGEGKNHAYGSLLYSSQQFNQDSMAYIAVDNVNIRTAASSNAPVAFMLGIANKVRLIETSEEKLSLNGIEANWCKIETSDKKTGYVWGGFLTTLYTQSYNWEDSTLFFIASLADKKNEAFTAQIRAVRDGKEIARKTFPMNKWAEAGYEAHLHNQEAWGLAEVKSIIRLDSYFPACGYNSDDHLLLWTGTEFVYGLSTSSGGDAGAYSHSEDVLTPMDKGGVSGHLLVSESTTSYDTEKEEMTVEEESYRITLYKWNKKKLEKVFSQSNEKAGKK